MAAVLLLGACSHQPVSPVAAAPSPSPPDEAGHAVRAANLTPRVDHHQHLLSPAGAALINRPLFPEVKVPPVVATLLTRRAELTGDPAGLARFFAEDALFLAPGKNGGWVRGAANSAKTISESFGPGYRMSPVSYAATGNAAQIAGYYTRGEGASVRRVGYFHMNLRRAKDGVWRIAAETPVFPGPYTEPVVDAERLVQLLDDAGVRRAIVLSDAYYFDAYDQPLKNAYQRVQAENDWTAAQVARYPDRLVAFCSFNPLANYALAELERCSRKLQFKGLKLHFDTSGVDIRKPEHARKVRAVVEAANRLRLPLIVHVVGPRMDPRAVTETLLKQIVPAATDVPFIVAHLWGGGPFSDELLEMYAEAVSAGGPAMKNLYFELAESSRIAGAAKNQEALASRIRQIGVERILFGSDAATPPKEAWAEFRSKVPLSDDEFGRIANNVLPSLH